MVIAGKSPNFPYCSRKPAPVEAGSLSHYLQFLLTIPGGAGFLPTTVGNTSSSRVDFPASHVTRK